MQSTIIRISSEYGLKDRRTRRPKYKTIVHKSHFVKIQILAFCQYTIYKKTRNMEQQNIYPFSSVNIWLTAEAVEWLSETTTDNNGNAISNMAIFSGLLKEMRTSPGYDGTFRRPLNLKPGQAQFSEIGLAEKWNLGRKKMHNILARMETAGLVAIYNSRIGSTVSFSCIMGWKNSDGKLVSNGFFADREPNQMCHEYPEVQV